MTRMLANLKTLFIAYCKCKDAVGTTSFRFSSIISHGVRGDAMFLVNSVILAPKLQLGRRVRPHVKYDIHDRKVSNTNHWCIFPVHSFHVNRPA